MSKLSECYAQKDKDRLKIGWEALIEINERLEDDKRAGLTSPTRTALSAILEQLSEEYANYHASQSACRGYIRDSVRMGRYFTPDRIEELKQYKLTSSHLLACMVKGKEWPLADEEETKVLLNWAIDHNASPSEIWDFRKGREEELSDIEKAKRRLISAVGHYMDVTSIVLGYDEERKVCAVLIKVFEEI